MALFFLLHDEGSIQFFFNFFLRRPCFFLWRVVISSNIFLGGFPMRYGFYQKCFMVAVVLGGVGLLVCLLLQALGVVAF